MIVIDLGQDSYSIIRENPFLADQLKDVFFLMNWDMLWKTRSTAHLKLERRDIIIKIDNRLFTFY